MSNKLYAGKKNIIYLIMALVFIVLSITVGLYMILRPDSPPQSNQSNGPEKSQKISPSLTGDKKTITYKGATYSLTVPTGWGFEESFLYPGDESNTKIVNIIDPKKGHQLEIQTTDYTGSLSSNNETLGSFKGIGGATYYFTGSYKEPNASGYEVVNISTCATSPCFTPVKAPYELIMSIRRTPENFGKGVNLEASEIMTIKQVIASIKIDN